MIMSLFFLPPPRFPRASEKTAAAPADQTKAVTFATTPFKAAPGLPQTNETAAAPADQTKADQTETRPPPGLPAPAEKPGPATESVILATTFKAPPGFKAPPPRPRTAEDIC